MAWVRKLGKVFFVFIFLFNFFFQFWIWLLHWGHQYHENSLFSTVSVLPLPLPPKPGSNGSYVGQNVSTQFPMLGEQFRNVNIVPQVIAVMKAEAQAPWPKRRDSLDTLKKAKITMEICKWNQQLLQTQIRQSKKFRLTSWDKLLSVHAWEKKGGKSSHKNWSECSCVLWW